MYASIEGKGFDIILENCADINLAKDFDLLGVNGRIAVSNYNFYCQSNYRSLKLYKSFVYVLIV